MCRGRLVRVVIRIRVRMTVSNQDGSEEGGTGDDEGEMV